MGLKNSTQHNTETLNNDDTLYILLFGMSSGKSCFLHQFCNGEFKGKFDLTLGSIFWKKYIEINSKQVKLLIEELGFYCRFEPESVISKV